MKHSSTLERLFLSRTLQVQAGVWKQAVTLVRTFADPAEVIKPMLHPT
jgi:hypothetical protein